MHVLLSIFLASLVLILQGSKELSMAHVLFFLSIPVKHWVSLRAQTKTHLTPDSLFSDIILTPHPLGLIHLCFSHWPKRALYPVWVLGSPLSFLKSSK